MAIKFLLICFVSFYLVKLIHWLSVKLQKPENDGYIDYIQKAINGEMSEVEAMKLDKLQSEAIRKQARERLHELNETSNKVRRFNNDLKYK